MKRYSYRTTCAAAGLLLACSSALAALDFETAGQYTGNFRQWGGSGVSHTISETIPSAANDYVKVDRTTGSGSSLVALYDKTSTNTADAWNTFNGTVTVTWDVMTTSATTSPSFGVLFINPTNTTKNALAILNINAAAAPQTPTVVDLDRLRFFINNPLDGAGIGPQLGGNVDRNVVGSGTYITVTATYTPATGVLTASAGSLSSSVTLSPADRAAIGSDVGVALRVNDADQWTPFAAFDNVSIVPEPASLGLAGVMSLGLLRRRRA